MLGLVIIISLKQTWIGKKYMCLNHLFSSAKISPCEMDDHCTASGLAMDIRGKCVCVAEDPVSECICQSSAFALKGCVHCCCNESKRLVQPTELQCYF